MAFSRLPRAILLGITRRKPHVRRRLQASEYWYAAAVDATNVLRRKLACETRHRANTEWELANARRIYRGILDDQINVNRGLTQRLNDALRERDDLRAQLAIREQNEQADAELKSTCLRPAGSAFGCG